MLNQFPASCKEKYTEHPAYFSSKLDVLAIKFKGVTELTTDFGVMNDKIATLQKSMPTLDETTAISVLRKGLNTINGRKDSIVSTLNLIALNGSTSKIVIDNLKNDLIALSLKVITDKDAMLSQIKGNGSTNIIQSYRLNELLISNNTLVIQISDVQKTLNSLTVFSGEAATQVAVDVLVVQMNCVMVSFDILLATYVP